jgi:hypothetical protein
MKKKTQYTRDEETTNENEKCMQYHYYITQRSAQTIHTMHTVHTIHIHSMISNEFLFTLIRYENNDLICQHTYRDEVRQVTLFNDSSAGITQETSGNRSATKTALGNYLAIEDSMVLPRDGYDFQDSKRRASQHSRSWRSEAIPLEGLAWGGMMEHARNF